MHEQGSQPLKLKLVINQRDLEIELDTRSAVSLVKISDQPERFRNRIRHQISC